LEAAETFYEALLKIWSVPAITLLIVAAVITARRLLKRIASPPQPKMPGHTATATVIGCRQDGKRDYVPLVSFVTASGERREAVPSSAGTTPIRRW
jgi:hypothetical protein